EAGHAIARTPMMYNDFLIVGPAEDPAGARAASSPIEAFRRIAGADARFVSRGDSSGTHFREVDLWREASVAPSGDWYVESGQGQGASLQIADERDAYTLTDRATFVTLGHLLELEIVHEGHGDLLNLYSVIQPTAARRRAEAEDLASWLTSSEGKDVIGTFRVRSDTTALFHPAVIGTRLPIPGAHTVVEDVTGAPHSDRGSDPRGPPTHNVG
ncbi:MAG: substrate-binding domain-containing protein, partial [Gemmatimonadetes bacterium]|nr:substrate-binding domain-containing protein [Gemmatimonadota bacterium]